MRALGKTNYGTLSDVTLAALTKKGDEKAFEEITIRYVKLIYSIASDYKIDNYDVQDLVQEGLLAFLIACKTYEQPKGASFKSFAVKCAKNRFNDLIKKVKSTGAVPKSSIVSMDNIGDNESDGQNVEDYVLEREYLCTLLNHIEKLLSAEEKTVFNMYAEGYSYKEIAEAINCTPKKVDNILQKIKRKLRE